MVQTEASSRSGQPAIPSSFRRAEALIALCQAKDARSFSVRAAQMYGFGVAFSYGIAMLLVSGSDGAATVQALLMDSLVSLSWVVGALSLFAATANAKTGDEADGIAALARQRGYAASALRSARYVATARRTTKFIAIPGLILAVLMLSRVASVSLLDWGLFFAVAVLAYALLLGATIGVLSHAATELLPSHPRLLLAAIVFVPLVAREMFPSVPSIPALFAWALEQMSALGALLR